MTITATRQSQFFHLVRCQKIERGVEMDEFEYYWWGTSICPLREKYDTEQKAVEEIEKIGYTVTRS